MYNFTGAADGGTPIGDLISQNGMLYGESRTGGAQNVGVVFRVVPANGSEKVLYDLQPNGQQADYGPNAGLATDGTSFYGITTYGGRENLGTVFKITP